MWSSHQTVWVTLKKRTQALAQETLLYSAGWLYETFSPEEAQRLCLRLEIHSTPKHGSWLNMAEIELSALGRQCLDRHLATLEEVQHEVAAWQQERNQQRVTIDWRFTTADARIKLKRLYPTIK